jgi:hypothetical protein
MSVRLDDPAALLCRKFDHDQVNNLLVIGLWDRSSRRQPKTTSPRSRSAITSWVGLRADRTRGQRGQQHSQVLDGLNRGVGVVDRWRERFAGRIDHLPHAKAGIFLRGALEPDPHRRLQVRRKRHCSCTRGLRGGGPDPRQWGTCGDVSPTRDRNRTFTLERYPAQQLDEHLVDQLHRHRRIMPRRP